MTRVPWKFKSCLLEIMSSRWLALVHCYGMLCQLVGPGHFLFFIFCHSNDILFEKNCQPFRLVIQLLSRNLCSNKPLYVDDGMHYRGTVRTHLSRFKVGMSDEIIIYLVWLSSDLKLLPWLIRPVWLLLVSDEWESTTIQCSCMLSPSLQFN